MGHTVPALRWIIYNKINQFKKIAKGLREPEKSIANSLIYNIHQSISAVVYANPYPKDLENSLIFASLVQEKKKGNVGIEGLTIILFSLMVMHEASKAENDRHADRLLAKERQDSIVD